MMGLDLGSVIQVTAESKKFFSFVIKNNMLLQLIKFEGKVTCLF